MCSPRLPGSRAGRTAARVLLAVFLATLGAGSAMAQHPNIARGFTPSGVFDVGGVDTVNAFNGNLNLRIPLGGRYPVGGVLGAYSLELVYNSNVWDFFETTSGCGANATDLLAVPLGNAGAGWRASLGSIGPPPPPTPPGGVPLAFEGIEYTAADGGIHWLAASDDPDFFFSKDGSFLRYRLSTRTLDFPDGTVHTFNSGGFPQSILDRFGNGLQVTYAFFPAPNSTLPSTWTLSDGFRSHTVRFRLTGISETSQTAVVDRVEVASFGGAVATYRFLYNGADENGNGFQEVRVRGFGTAQQTCAGVPAWNPRVFLLTKVILPDTTSYSMPVTDYFPTDPFIPSAGLLQGMKLPVGGRIAWSYNIRSLPFPHADDPLHPVVDYSQVLGVQKRTLLDGASKTIGQWTYSHQWTGNEVVSQVTYPPGDPSQTTGPRIVTYFSSCIRDTCDNGDGTTNLARDYGLPLSRRRVDPVRPATGDRFLSQEIFAPGATAPVRRVYVQYEDDGGPAVSGEPPAPPLYAFNSRQRSQRTEFLDDPLTKDRTQLAWTAVDSDGFDGMGHFRLMTTRDNFPGFNTARTVETGWNSERDGTPKAPPANDHPWVLNTYAFREQREGRATYREEFLFEADTGQLRCQRWLKNAGARGEHDVAVVYDHRADGQITRESWYGGDTKETATDPDCAGFLPPPADCSAPPSAEALAPAYAFCHDYAAGSRSRTRVSLAKTSGSTSQNLLNLAIDAATGLARESLDPGGRVTNSTYDVMGRLASMTTPGDATAGIVYQFSPLPVTVDWTLGPAGAPLERARFTLDALGRVEQEAVMLPGGAWSASKRSFNALGWPLFVSESSTSAVTGSACSMNADDLNNPNVVKPAGTSYCDYDPFGRAGRVIAADGKVTTLGFRGARVLTRSERVWSLAKDKDGKDVPAEVLATTKQFFDALGRLREVREPNGITARYTYDPAGHLVAVVVRGGGNSQPRSFDFDGRGFLIKERQPESGTTTYKYDARGNLKVRSTPTETLFYSYDGAGRRTIVSTPQARLTEVKYAEEGLDAGKPEHAVAQNYRRNGSACSRFDVVQDFTYEPEHGRIKDVKTSLAQESAPQNLEQWTQSYTYDDAGRVSQVTYPCLLTQGACASSRTVDTNYSMGRPVSIPGFAANITYAGNGTVGSIQHANGVVFTLTSDPSGIPRPRSLGAKLGSTDLWPAETYTYDGSGNISGIGAKTYVYDLGSRLIRSGVPSAGTQGYKEYAYDSFGNLTQVSTGTAPGNISSSILYATNPANNRLEGASYNASGNLTGYQGWSYAWDSLQHLATVNTGSEAWVHSYDANGERVWSWRTAPTRVDTFALRGAEDEILSDFTKSGTTYSWEDYVYREGQLLGARFSDATIKHFDIDHLGSVRLETNQINPSGTARYRDFWPYGQQATPLSTAPLDVEEMKFTGHERDLGSPSTTADDFDYVHARYYNPQFGRFLSVDPRAGLLDRSGTWNRYSYGLDNPLRYVDRDGKSGIEAVKVFFKVLGATQIVIGPRPVTQAYVEAMPWVYRLARPDWTEGMQKAFEAGLRVLKSLGLKGKVIVPSEAALYGGKYTQAELAALKEGLGGLKVGAGATLGAVTFSFLGMFFTANTNSDEMNELINLYDTNRMSKENREEFRRCSMGELGGDCASRLLSRIKEEEKREKARRKQAECNGSSSDCREP